MAKESKISVKHFLNKQLKAREDKYWVYVRVIYKRKKIEFPSSYHAYYGTNSDLGETPYIFALNEEQFRTLYKEQFELEANCIKQAIKYYHQSFDKNLLEEESPKNILSGYTWSLKDRLSTLMKSNLYDFMLEEKSNLWSIIRWDSVEYNQLFEGINGETRLPIIFKEYYRILNAVEFSKMRTIEFLDKIESKKETKMPIAENDKDIVLSLLLGKK